MIVFLLASCACVVFSPPQCKPRASECQCYLHLLVVLLPLLQKLVDVVLLPLVLCTNLGEIAQELLVALPQVDKNRALFQRPAVGAVGCIRLFI